MKALSSWAATVPLHIADSTILFETTSMDYVFRVYNLGTSTWITVTWPDGGTMAFRTAFDLGSTLELKDIHAHKDNMVFNLVNDLGVYEVTIAFPKTEPLLLHYTTSFQPYKPVLIPFWPRDIIPMPQTGHIEHTFGTLHVQQIGTRSGLLFASYTKPKTGSFLYFQNLTLLSSYCEATKTSLADSVGGVWPEIGFKLPVTTDTPLPAEKFIVSDAYILFNKSIYDTDLDIATNYLNMLSILYKKLPKPEIQYTDWQDISKKALTDLTMNKGCWTHCEGHPYLNAYLCDYQTPAEIMVQLAVQYAVVEHAAWSGEDYPIINDIKGGIASFYDAKLKTISRWLPSKRDALDRSEEQKHPMVMDSWYLHHPLLNLSKLALEGNAEAKTLLLKSLDYAITVARHFKYQWPVFYNMDTLEVIKAETAVGKGGEKDVGGGYALLMLNVWKLTKEKKYLTEAIKAVRPLNTYGMEIFYQANTTAFSALATLRLYKETRDIHFLNISYLCIAGIMKNVQLWECNYGNAKPFKNFFGVFPLGNAPYKAAYEEMEVYAALNDYIIEATRMKAPILPSLYILLPEYVKYSIDRLASFYPPLMPTDAFSEEVKTGELDLKLWIPVEDLYDGWEPNGQVGQEVYGAGVGFGVVPRQYHKIKDEAFLMYCNYPIQILKTKKRRTFVFKILGDAGLVCKLRIISKTDVTPTYFNAVVEKKITTLKALQVNASTLEYTVFGDSTVTLTWKKL